MDHSNNKSPLKSSSDLSQMIGDLEYFKNQAKKQEEEKLLQQQEEEEQRRVKELAVTKTPSSPSSALKQITPPHSQTKSSPQRNNNNNNNNNDSSSNSSNDYANVVVSSFDQQIQANKLSEQTKRSVRFNDKDDVVMPSPQSSNSSTLTPTPPINRNNDVNNNNNSTQEEEYEQDDSQEDEEGYKSSYQPSFTLSADTQELIFTFDDDDEDDDEDDDQDYDESMSIGDESQSIYAGYQSISLPLWDAVTSQDPRIVFGRGGKRIKRKRGITIPNWKKQHPDVTIDDMMKQNYLMIGDRLTYTVGGRTHTAILLKDGYIEYGEGNQLRERLESVHTWIIKILSSLEPNKKFHWFSPWDSIFVKGKSLNHIRKVFEGRNRRTNITTKDEKKYIPDKSINNNNNQNNDTKNNNELKKEVNSNNKRPIETSSSSSPTPSPSQDRIKRLKDATVYCRKESDRFIEDNIPTQAMGDHDDVDLNNTSFGSNHSMDLSNDKLTNLAQPKTPAPSPATSQDNQRHPPSQHSQNTPSQSKSTPNSFVLPEETSLQPIKQISQQEDPTPSPQKSSQGSDTKQQSPQPSQQSSQQLVNAQPGQLASQPSQPTPSPSQQPITNQPSQPSPPSSQPSILGQQSIPSIQPSSQQQASSFIQPGQPSQPSPPSSQTSSLGQQSIPSSQSSLSSQQQQPSIKSQTSNLSQQPSIPLQEQQSASPSKPSLSSLQPKSQSQSSQNPSQPKSPVKQSVIVVGSPKPISSPQSSNVGSLNSEKSKQSLPLHQPSPIFTQEFAQPKSPSPTTTTTNTINNPPQSLLFNSSLPQQQQQASQPSQDDFIPYQIPKSQTELPVILGTGLTSLMQLHITSLVQAIGGKYVTQYNNSVTHVVCGSADDPTKLTKRTIKYQLGIVSGVWLVTFDWILDSLCERRWVEEDPYEIAGDDVATGSPNKARQQILYNQKRLFYGYSFYLAGDFDRPSKAEIEAVLRESGGIILTTLPPRPTNTKELLHSKCMVIAHPHFTNQPHLIQSIYLETRHHPVSYKWIFDCVSHYEILPLHNDPKYIIHGSKLSLQDMATQQSAAY